MSLYIQPQAQTVAWVEHQSAETAIAGNLPGPLPTVQGHISCHIGSSRSVLGKLPVAWSGAKAEAALKVSSYFIVPVALPAVQPCVPFQGNTQPPVLLPESSSEPGISRKLWRDRGKEVMKNARAYRLESLRDIRSLSCVQGRFSYSCRFSSS